MAPRALSGPLDLEFGGLVCEESLARWNDIGDRHDRPFRQGPLLDRGVAHDVAAKVPALVRSVAAVLPHVWRVAGVVDVVGRGGNVAEVIFLPDDPEHAGKKWQMEVSRASGEITAIAPSSTRETCVRGQVGRILIGRSLSASENRPQEVGRGKRRDLQEITREQQSGQ
jgi:hypothetical protein